MPFLLVVVLSIWLKLKGARLSYLAGFIVFGFAIPFVISQLLLVAGVSGPGLNLIAVPIGCLLVGIAAIFVYRVGCDVS